MPFDSADAFAPLDPSELARIRALPHIVVRPKPPPNAPIPEGIDDWIAPGGPFDGPDDWIAPANAPSNTSYPNDWFVPPPTAMPGTGRFPPGAEPSSANSSSVYPAARPDPFTAYWSQIPASRIGALAWAPPYLAPLGPSFSTNNFPAPAPPLPFGSRPPTLGVGATAWDPPIFPGNSLNNSVAPSWRAAPSLPTVIPNIPTGGLLDGLAKLAPWTPGSGIPLGGMLDALAQLGSSSPAPASSIPSGGILDALARLGPAPDPGSLFPSPARPQSADAQTISPVGRRPIADYSNGEILGDAAKSFGVGVGRFGIQSAGLLGDAREMLASAAQPAVDYFAPGSAPNAGSKLSEVLASYPLLAGPTSAQLQKAVESYTGPFYQPKTIVGDYAKTAGEFVPGALLMPEGNLALNALRYGLLPALSSETAGQLTQGTAAEPWARTFGAILGAAPGAWRNLPWPRSAPDVAETLAKSKLSPAKNITQVTLNKAVGDAWEAEGRDNILPKTQVNIQPQITIKSKGASGLKVRADAIGQDRTTGEITLSDMKASDTAPFTRNQTTVYPELEAHGGVVVGKGKAPYVGGTRIPPTQVTIIRKPGS